MRWSWRWSAGICTAAAVVLFTARSLPRSPVARLSPQAVAALNADGMTPLGGRPAPGFTLTAQDGRPVSLAQLRGRAVVLAFLDPVCWSECPLQAQEMKAVDALLGPRANQVELLAVAANPIYHSVQDVQRFDAQEGLEGLPNWTFATSAALGPLQRVWSEYSAQVTVPEDGMVDHSQVFYIIGPRGDLDYVSSPEDDPNVFAGTSELLATYVLQVLHEPGAVGSVGKSLPAPVASTPITVPGPVALDFWSASQGLVVLDSPPYQLVYATADGGRTWTNEGPPGIGKEGGIAWSWGGPGAAWILIRPFYWMEDAAVEETSDGARSWSGMSVLPGTPAAGATAPLAGDGSGAGALVGGRLWTTAGSSWTPGPALPAGVTDPGLGWSPGGTAWLGGGGGAGARLWRLAGGAWSAVALPVPASLRGDAVTTLPPVWQDAAHALAVGVAGSGGEELAFVDATADGGRTWAPALPPLPAAAPLGGGVQVAGGRVYALAARGGGTVVETGSAGAWRPLGVPLPGGAGRAVDFLSPELGFAVTGGRAGTTLYATSDGGRSWSPLPMPRPS